METLISMSKSIARSKTDAVNFSKVRQLASVSSLATVTLPRICFTFAKACGV